MLRASGRARKPSERALESAASAAAAAAPAAAVVKKAKVKAKAPAKASIKAPVEKVPVAKAPTKDTSANNAPARVPVKKVSAKTTALDDKDEDEDEQQNECADDNDRTGIFDAKALKGRFPFVEERIIGERKCRNSKTREKPVHDVLISAVPRWIEADRADNQLMTAWNNHISGNRRILSLDMNKWNEMNLLRGHPMLDELSVMGTKDWQEAESRRLAHVAQTDDAFNMFSLIIRTATAQAELMKGLDMYVYANDNDESDVGDPRFGTAPELLQTMLQWHLDNDTAEHYEQHPELIEIELACGGRPDINANEIFLAIFSIFDNDLGYDLGSKNVALGRRFVRETSVHRRRQIGRDLIEKCPHVLHGDDSTWMKLLITLLLPLEVLHRALPTQYQLDATNWQANAISNGLSLYHATYSEDAGSFVGSVMPTFLALTHILQEQEDVMQADEGGNDGNDEDGKNGKDDKEEGQNEDVSEDQAGDSRDKRGSSKKGSKNTDVGSSNGNNVGPGPSTKANSKANRTVRRSELLASSTASTSGSTSKNSASQKPAASKANIQPIDLDNDELSDYVDDELNEAELDEATMGEGHSLFPTMGDITNITPAAADTPSSTGLDDDDQIPANPSSRKKRKQPAPPVGSASNKKKARTG